MIVLERTYHGDRTTGVLWAYHGQKFATIELPWRGNALGRSCVPEGDFTLIRDRTGRHKWYRFDDGEVYPRSAIEIHEAAEASQLLGCIGTTPECLHHLVSSMPAGDVIRITSKGPRVR